MKDARPIFCIVDPSLKNFVGHHFSYDEAVALGAEEAGFQPVVLGNREAEGTVETRVNLVRCFRSDIWADSPLTRFLPERHRSAGNILFANTTFYRDLTTRLKELAPPEGSVLFAHMIYRHQLLGLARLASRQPVRGGLRMVLLLRYQSRFYDDPLSAKAFRQLERAVKRGKHVRLASDSARLAEELSALTSLPIEVMPIPHSGLKMPMSAAPPRKRVRFASLGNARDEKGYLEILEAIRHLDAQGNLADFEFVLQSNDAQPDVQAAIDAFARHCPENVTLLNKALTPEEYGLALAEADVVLLPYWREIYSARTSGVFLEAAAAGKPVIATQDTWMSDELKCHAAGIVVKDHDPKGLAAAITEAGANLDALSLRARQCSKVCLTAHNPHALIDQVLNGAPPIDVTDKGIQRIAVLYPWGDFLARGAGASVRVNMLVDTLSPHVESVRVLQSGNAPRTQRDNVTIEAQPVRIRQNLLRRAFRLPFRLLLGRDGFGEELPLWFHFEPLLDPLFHKKVDQLVRWADVVLLEYSYWGPVVLPICRSANTPCVLTNHDVLSEQVRSSNLLRKLTWMVERRVLCSADTVVSVAPGDQEWFASEGIPSELIPNPVDMTRARIPMPADARLALKLLYGIALPSGPLCLFVGSWFPPNIEAARRIQQLAPTVRGVGFVVAGAAMTPMSEGNFVALGTVEHTALALLYRAATMALIPLPYGTGSSLKTLEAMGHGLTVLGTPTAFRGLAVESGRHCLIEEELERWPAIIRRSTEDFAQLTEVGRAASSFANAYHYRSVLSSYFSLIGLEHDPEVAEKIETVEGTLAAERLLDDLCGRALLNDSMEATELAMSLFLKEPLAPAASRGVQIRRAVLACMDRREFSLASRLLQLAELLAGSSGTTGDTSKPRARRV